MQISRNILFRRFIIGMLSAAGFGSLFRLFFGSLCPQLQSMDAAWSIELFLQQSVDHSMASRLHLGLECIRDYVQTGARQ